MNTRDTHPDSTRLDQLRAGLLDDDPVQKTALKHHLRQCPQCQQRYAWPASVLTPDTGLDDRLRQMRQQALATTRSWSHRFIPVATAAAIALIAVTLLNVVPVQHPSDAQLSATEKEIPEVYEDPDFYLWLADHDAGSDSST